MLFFTVLFGVISVVGVAGTFYFGLQYRRLAQQRYRFSWADIEQGSRSIANSCLRRFKPEAVLTFVGPGSVIANLAFVYARKFVPGYLVSDFPTNSSASQNLTDTHILAQTGKWQLWIPKAFLKFANRRVSILHDSCISGTGIASVIEVLIANGFERDRIKVGCLVCTKAARDAGLAPDHHAFLVENNDFHYPWGKRI